MKKNVIRNEIDIVIDNGNLPSSSSLAEKYGVSNNFNDDSLSHVNNVDHSIFEATTQKKIDSMHSKIEEKNRKIENLCVLLEALEPVPGMHPRKYKELIEGDVDDNVDFRDSKIVALAKKSHNLTMLLNKERSEHDEQKRKVKTLKAELEMATQQACVVVTKPAEAKGYGRHAKTGEDSEEGQKVIALTKELRDMSRTVDELKKRVTAQNEENKRLEKALMRELGEGVSLEQAVDGGWRGRAQQIIMLKSKVKKLEKSLADASSSNGEQQQQQHQSGDVDTKAQEDLASMGNVRRRIVDALTEERVSLTECNQQLEKKNNAQKARINILESEVKRIKDNFQVVLDKSQTDDELLDVLRNEVTRLKTQLKNNVANASNNASQSNNSSSSHSQQERDMKEAQMLTEITRLQRLCKNQAEQIDSQDQTIRQLKKRVVT